jgi:4'-phosphopantetheinyl transferase
MVTPLSWHTAPLKPKLEGHDIHVYHLDLSLFQNQTQELICFLNSVEQEQAQNMAQTNKKNSFIITKSFLRKILSNYLDCSSQSIILDKTQSGKPFLNSHHDLDIKFNLAHSHNKAILAFCLKTQIGIDLEKLRKVSRAQEILAKHGLDEEINSFNTVPEKHKDEAFLRGWTRKEALIKAMGQKMATHAKQYSVNFSLFPKNKILNNETTNKENQHWTLCDLTIEDYVGTVALKRTLNNLSLWHV